MDFFGGDVIRVCIEVYMNQPLVKGVKVDNGDGAFWKTFRYEVSRLCYDCGRLDHKQEHCSYPCPRNRGSKSNINYGSHSLAPRREHESQLIHYFSWHCLAARCGSC